MKNKKNKLVFVPFQFRTIYPEIAFETMEDFLEYMKRFDPYQKYKIYSMVFHKSFKSKPILDKGNSYTGSIVYKKNEQSNSYNSPFIAYNYTVRVLSLF